jgi:Essential protein Yae1, N terminal
MESDPFDDLLGLEDRFYNEGFQLGTTDGVKAGRIEGRAFGLEKGFEKYVEIGRLHGKSLVWAGRLSKFQTSDTEASHVTEDGVSEQAASPLNEESSTFLNLPPLPTNPRLEKHIKILYALTEPASLSTDNSEDAVSSFDDRLKRAIGKVKIVEKLVGEEGLTSGANRGRQNEGSGGDGGIEDISILRARH